VQEFIGESKGRRHPLFRRRRKVVAAMRRQAREGEFRSNLHRGGSASATDLNAKEIDVALRAARTMD
jgi:ribosomal protein S6--L-glutamate ligase